MLGVSASPLGSKIGLRGYSLVATLRWLVVDCSVPPLAADPQSKPWRTKIALNGSGDKAIAECRTSDDGEKYRGKNRAPRETVARYCNEESGGGQDR